MNEIWRNPRHKVENTHPEVDVLFCRLAMPGKASAAFPGGEKILKEWANAIVDVDRSNFVVATNRDLQKTGLGRKKLIPRRNLYF